MKLKAEQLEAAAYLFEKANGNELKTYQKDLIEASGLLIYSIQEIEKIIIDGFDNELYNSEKERADVYWSLGKKYNKYLVPLFQKWLKSELLLENPNTLYQLMISLDNLDEHVFGKHRNGSYSVDETELNIQDAQYYLERIN